ncbi:hypothetical protein [Halosimplex carlsbadense]|uniref:hypothetical protein n=1 Tax=Halosimplex carlsbadense TaxID=171164 RepID=UPI001267CF13|nr:hypothetical protein [Halosimplex carlsbadense]
MSVQHSSQVELQLIPELVELADPEEATPQQVVQLVDWAETCPLCSDVLGEDRYWFSVYPEPSLEFTIPGTPATHVRLCEECGDRVFDLTHSWERTPTEEYGLRVPVYETYINSVDECCSCEEELERPALGIEISLNVQKSEFDLNASYTVCSSCSEIFERFLQGVDKDR